MVTVQVLNRSFYFNIPRPAPATRKTGRSSSAALRRIEGLALKVPLCSKSPYSLSRYTDCTDFSLLSCRYSDASNYLPLFHIAGIQHRQVILAAFRTEGGQHPEVGVAVSGGSHGGMIAGGSLDEGSGVYRGSHHILEFSAL